MDAYKKLSQEMLRQWRTMELEDVAAWKLCMVLCGMLLAIYHEALCKKAQVLIWLGFLATLGHTMWWFAKSIKKLIG